MGEDDYDNDDFASRVGTSVSSSPRAGRPLAKTRNSDSVPEGVSEYSGWGKSGFYFFGVSRFHPALPAGLYKPAHLGDRGFGFHQILVSTDSLLHLPDSESEAVLAEIRQFRTLRESFRNFGFIWKRGILLWGAPGSGKTTTCQQLCDLVVAKEDGIALIIDDPGTASNCMQLLRQVEPDRPILGILEDIDALVEIHGQNEMLSLLDGETQVDNIVFVATTNYPERLDRRFVDRPSRFDIIKLIGMPTDDSRRAFLKAKLPTHPSDFIESIVDVSKGLSIAHLKEFIVLTQCLNLSVDEAAARINKNHKRKYKSGDAEPTEFGFRN